MNGANDLERRLRDHLTSVDEAPVRADLDGLVSAARTRVARRRISGLALAGLAVIGGIAAVASRNTADQVAVSASTTAAAITATTEDPSPYSNRWTTIASDPRGVHPNPATVWTGSEAILVGGTTFGGVAWREATAYNPATDSWRRLANPTSTDRLDPIAVWTGSEVLVVGGQMRIANANGTVDPKPIHTTAESYNPATDTWRPLADPPAEITRSGSAHVWTGSELLVTACACNAGTSAGLWSYDPATDAWRSLPDIPGGIRLYAASVWTGSEWLVWGGTAPPLSSSNTNTGAAYNPTTNTWRTMAPSPLSPRQTSAVWTGTEMFVIGGRSSISNGMSVYGDNAAYNPTTDSWRELPEGPQHPGSQLVWTGSTLFTVVKSTVFGFDPAANEWTEYCCNETGVFCGWMTTPIVVGNEVILVGSDSTDGGGLRFRLSA